MRVKHILIGSDGYAASIANNSPLIRALTSAMIRLYHTKKSCTMQDFLIIFLLIFALH